MLIDEDDNCAYIPCDSHSQILSTCKLLQVLVHHAVYIIIGL